MRRWESALRHHGAHVANNNGNSIPTILGSTDFMFPLLVSEVLSSIVIAGALAVAGSIFLIFVFTFGNLFLTLVGTLIMVVILAVAICIKLYAASPVFDLLDVFILVALTGNIRPCCSQSSGCVNNVAAVYNVR
jgi:hypothetical protein